VKAGPRILVVEDDRSIARRVQLELEHRNFAVRCAYDGPSGLEAVSDFKPAVIVLDIMLPKLDGVGVLKKLRAAGNRVPVIMLTARGDQLDKVHSLDRGADDYLTKPFDMEELMARLRALLRRAGEDEVIRVADLEIDTATREVRRGTREIDLTGSGNLSPASGRTSWTCTSGTCARRWTLLGRPGSSRPCGEPGTP
jgi:DNA-binding response OmpR family regulator